MAVAVAVAVAVEMEVEMEVGRAVVCFPVGGSAMAVMRLSVKRRRVVFGRIGALPPSPMRWRSPRREIRS
jgi:hypothetical protein